MKLPKRKAKRISDRPVKLAVAKEYDSEKHLVNSYPDSYAGTEEELLKKVVEVIVRIIQKELDL